jgi:hypothetical protein
MMNIKNVNKSEETNKRKLTTGLLLVPVDIGTRLEIPVVYLTIRNPKGVFDVAGNSRGIGREISNKVGSIKTVINGLISILECKFILESGIDMRIEKLFKLPPPRAQSILSISCSLSNPTILFSPLVYSFTNSIIEETPHRVRCYPAKILKLNKIEVEIDEEKILNIIERILKYKTSVFGKGNIIENNIVESINNYQSALISTNSFLRYISLYQSFEKAVNADKDRSGKDFVKHASKLIGFTESKIKKLLKFYDRIKHVFRNTDDILTMENNIKNFSELALRMKKAADNAILYRIGL